MENMSSCHICGKNYKQYRSSQKFCGNSCKKKKELAKNKRNYLLTIPTGTVGAISELLVSSDMMKKGYSVFRALSPSCFCDVIAIRDSKMLKVEIKTGHFNRTNNNMNYLKTKHKEVDIYGICDRETGSIFYFKLNGEKYEI